MVFLAEWFIRGFLKFFFSISPRHIVVPLNPRDHDMKKTHESTLPEEAFTQVTAFLAAWFLR